jgi:hypothetical protein
MVRAMVTYERDVDREFVPTAAWLAWRDHLEARWLPGDQERDVWMGAVLRDALPPTVDDISDERGTFELWIDWALGDGDRFGGAFTNGHTRWAVEVVPTPSIEQLYEREVGEPARERAARPAPPKPEPSPAIHIEAALRPAAFLDRRMPQEQPSWYRKLPRFEQAWRGRLFLMTWCFTGSGPYAWHVASVADETEALGFRELVASVSDDQIAASLEETAGQRSAVTFWSLGIPDLPAKMDARTPLDERARRYLEIRAMRTRGATLKEIGDRFGTTRERIRQILRRPPAATGRPKRPNES